MLAALALVAASELTMSATPVAPLTRQPATLDVAALENTVQQEMRDTNTPGAAVVVVRGDEVVYLKGFGVASVDTGEPVTPDTLFRLGSTTKMFTGLTAVLAEESRRLALDAPIKSVASDLAAPIGELTLHQLLTHTAGVIQEGAGDGSHDDDALGRRVRGWTASHVFAPQGDVYSYSSPGYWLAGYVIEAADRRPFADVVADRVFGPVGMTRSTFRPLVALTHPMAQDHRVAKGTAAVVRPYPDDVSTWPGGSMFSSVRDLSRFASAFLGGGLLEGRRVLPAAAVAALAARKVDSGGGCGYTYGLAECTVRGVRTLSHYGFRSGSGSIVRFVPSERLAVIILANRSGGILARTESAILRMLLPSAAADAAPDPPLRAATGAEAARLAGRYVNGRDVLTLAVVDGGLSYRYADEAALPVRMAGPAELVVTTAAGEPVQRFLVVQGRVTGDQYLSDGTAAFRREKK